MMKVIMSIGIPGSGKTTALRPLAEKLGYGYINRDDIRLELTGDPTDHTREPDVSALAYERLAEALQFGGVIIDGTLSKRKDRIETVLACRELGATEITAMWFKVSLEVCMKRNRQRERMVPERVLIQMQRRFDAQPPALDEGYDIILTVKD
jgi:predicted kinase